MEKPGTKLVFWILPLRDCFHVFKYFSHYLMMFFNSKAQLFILHLHQQNQTDCKWHIPWLVFDFHKRGHGQSKTALHKNALSKTHHHSSFVIIIRFLFSILFSAVKFELRTLCNLSTSIYLSKTMTVLLALPTHIPTI